MTTPCLICDSSAVLTQDARNALIHLAYALNGFSRSGVRIHVISFPLDYLSNQMVNPM